MEKFRIVVLLFLISYTYNECYPGYFMAEVGCWPCLGGYYSDGYGDKCSPCPAGTYLEQSPLLVQSVLLDLIPPVNQILAFLALQEHI